MRSPLLRALAEGAAGDTAAGAGAAGAASGAQLWIVDPHGNLVLRYDGKANGKAILDDLKHLLKISQIG